MQNIAGLTNDRLLFRSGPMLLKDDDRTHNTVFMGVIGTWPFLILLLSSAAIAGVIMWALVSTCTDITFKFNKESKRNSKRSIDFCRSVKNFNLHEVKTKRH